MNLNDVDLTVTEFFSKRGERRLTGAASPRHKLVSLFGIIPVPGLVHTKKNCRPKFTPLYKERHGHEERMMERGHRPLIRSGTRRQLESDEDLFQAIDSDYCDCCGRYLQRHPRQVANNHGTLCPICHEYLERLLSKAFVDGPWTLVYGPETGVTSEREFSRVQQSLDAVRVVSEEELELLPQIQPDV